LINIAAGVSGRWTSSISSRSDWVTAPTARNRSESLDTELCAGPTIPMGLSFPHMRIFCAWMPGRPQNLLRSRSLRHTVGARSGSLPLSPQIFLPLVHGERGGLRPI
jgi:hypothetical protein